MLTPPNFHENVKRRQKVKVQSFQSFNKRIPQISCNADELSKAASLYKYVENIGYLETITNFCADCETKYQ